MMPQHGQDSSGGTTDLLSAALDEAGLDDFMSLDADPFPTPPDYPMYQEVDDPPAVPQPQPPPQPQPQSQPQRQQPAVRIQMLPATTTTTASSVRTVNPQQLQLRTSITLPAATTTGASSVPPVIRPLTGNHVIKTMDGRSIIIRPAGSVVPAATTAGNIQVIKKPDGTSQYMIIRKATPATVPFRQLTPQSSPNNPIRVSSDQVLQLKNVINNMNRAAAAAAAASNPGSSQRLPQPQQQIILNNSHNLTHWSTTGQQMYSQPKVILKTKSSSRPASPSSMSLLANNGNNSSPGASAKSPAAVKPEPEPEEEVDDLVEDEDHFQAETYADYMPLKLKIGAKHPDPVVETASLSSVHPPNVWYRMAIGEDVIDSGKLSALQLEAITYACQQHEQFLRDGSRAGFLLGDGAGVGKGRTLAGVIYENYLLGRKRAIWLSVSNDLRYDAERDLRDIGAKKISVWPLNKFKYGKISGKENNGVKKGVIFATYSSLIGESHTSNNKYRTRLKQLLHWCGEDFDGVIVFDECHKAKNLCPAGSSKPTKTGLTVLELQKQLPKARIVYASATGASEPKNMAYMVRLGLWGPGTSFPEFTDFVQTVEKRGVGAMELVAIDMKLRGVYIARQLSFSGVQFRIEEIKLSNKFIGLYDECVAIWVDAKNKIDKALELLEDDPHIKKAVWGQFWAAHQRFFKYLCIASKVKHAVGLARDALKSNKCVVIGLQSTGEAKTLEALEDQGGELTDFVSTAKAVFYTLIDKHFPAPNRKKTLAILNRGSSSIFEDLNSVNGGKSRNPVDEIMRKYENESKTQTQSHVKKGGVWSCSDSEDENNHPADRDSAFDSDSSDDEDDFVSVSEGSDIDEMWDNFASGVQDKANKKKKRKKKSVKKKKASTTTKRKAGGEKVAKKAKIEKKGESFDALLSTKADFMSDEALELCEKMRDSLLEQIEELAPRLPPNTLDELIDEMGGPEHVAEMTGRKGRVTTTDSGSIQYETRTENDVALEVLNVTEKKRFNDGEKEIAIISEAASSGISLHSDKRCLNRKRRVHITIELPWSADRAIQQFGRTHRSNQSSAPEYIFLISDLAGEQRFASIVAKRLESLGALTHGDRRATESRDLSKYNIDNKYGRQALEIVMKSIIGLEKPWVPPPETNFANFFKSTRVAFLGVGLITKNADGSYNLEKDFNLIAKFLNRLLGIEVELQNAIFKYFTETLEAVVKQAKRLGRFDMGIIDLTSDSAKIEPRSRQVFYHKHSTGAAKIELHEVAVERGMSWDEAKGLATHCKPGSDEGFYLMGVPDASDSANNNKKKSSTSPGNVFLAVADTSVKTFSKQVFRIYRPNTGLQSKTETATSLKESSAYRKATTPEEAESVWVKIFEESAKKCVHEIRSGKCSRRSTGLLCDVGLRQRVYHILSGSVLSLWEMIEKTLPASLAASASKLQMARLKTADGQRVIGTLVPEKAVPLLINALSDPKPKAESAATGGGKTAATAAGGTSLLASKSSSSSTSGQASIIDIEEEQHQPQPQAARPALSVPIFNTETLD